MQIAGETYCPEWVDDHRRFRRWIDTRTVLASLDGEESLGKTRDISLGGMRLALPRLAPSVGRRLQVAVVFGDRVMDLDGTVSHRIDADDDGAVGLVFDQPLEARVADYLAERYPPAMHTSSTSR